MTCATLVASAFRFSSSWKPNPALQGSERSKKAGFYTHSKKNLPRATSNVAKSSFAALHRWLRLVSSAVRCSIRQYRFPAVFVSGNARSWMKREASPKRRAWVR
jgi:hypothetical protein